MTWKMFKDMDTLTEIKILLATGFPRHFIKQCEWFDLIVQKF